MILLSLKATALEKAYSINVSILFLNIAFIQSFRHCNLSHP